MACAWAGFCGYGIAMLLSYFVGQKKYPIQYDLKAIGSYVLLAAVLYLAAEYVDRKYLPAYGVPYRFVAGLCGLYRAA